MKAAVPLVEAAVAGIILSCLGLSVWLEANGAGQVAWAEFFPAYFSALGLLFIGQWYRLKGRSERIAAALIVSGLYVAFTNAAATLNYLVHPGVLGGGGTFDVFLVRIDAWLGFNWETFVSWFESYGPLSYFLRIVYQSSLLQLLIVILFLGFTGRVRRLHEFLLVGVASALLSILIWAMAPSFGPARLTDLPAGLSENLQLVIGADYVKHLDAVAVGEVEVIRRSSMRGLIAFPSMHTVMALMAVYFTVGTRVFPYLLAINIPMAPAILLHGGHHLADVIGGITVFFVVLVLVRNVMNAGEW